MKINQLRVAFSFCLILTSHLTFGQKNEKWFIERIINYKMIYIPDSSNQSNVREESMVLLLGDKGSLFLSKKKFDEDHADLSSLGKTPGIGMSAAGTIPYKIMKTGDEITYYDNQPIVSQNDFMYYYTESANNLKWYIKENMRDIEGFSCQLAELKYGGRSWEAWFCTDVPISNGPYKFGGLPGLIMHAYDDKRQWEFLFTSITRGDSLSIVPLFNKNEWEYLDKKEFYDKKKKMLDQAFELREASGRISFPTPQDRDILYKRFKEIREKDNNWIELYP